MEKEKRKYSIEFKIKAVELSNQRGSVMSAAEELNIPHDNLRRWKKEYAEGHFSLSRKPLEISKEELEIIKLKKELYDTQLERDILKKAVSIFSKNDK
jgi:transposase